MINGIEDTGGGGGASIFGSFGAAGGGILGIGGVGGIFGIGGAANPPPAGVGAWAASPGTSSDGASLGREMICVYGLGPAGTSAGVGAT